MTKLKWCDDLDKEVFIQETYEILQQSQREHNEKYIIQVQNKSFVMYPNVFPSNYFNDTHFFSSNLPFLEGEDFLEIGVGAGIISIFAALQGANVTGVDISPFAVENSIENATLHKVENLTNFFVSDIFENIPKDKKFDTIFWNVPFGCVKVQLNLLEKSVFDTDYNSIERFIMNSHNYLKKNGKLLVGFSTCMGEFDKLLSFFKNADFNNIVKIAETSFEGSRKYITFEIFQAKFNN